MGRKKNKSTRNSPCSCGSGKKFKNCCQNKPIMSRPESTAPRLRRRPQRAAGSVALATLNAVTDANIQLDNVAGAMHRAGFTDAQIYAYGKTGRIVNETSREALPPSLVQEWDDAIAEYKAANPEENNANDTDDVQETTPAGQEPAEE